MSIKRVYTATFLASLLYFAIMIGFVCTLQNHLMSVKLKTAYGAITSIVFGIDSAGLLYTTRLLILTLKRDFQDQMKAEAQVLSSLFVVFTISYLLRTFLLAPEGHWYQIQHFFRPNASRQNQYFIRMVLYFISFLLWDILPIFLQLLMHHKNFRPETQRFKDC